MTNDDGKPLVYTVFHAEFEIGLGFIDFSPPRSICSSFFLFFECVFRSLAPPGQFFKRPREEAPGQSRTGALYLIYDIIFGRITKNFFLISYRNTVLVVVLRVSLRCPVSSDSYSFISFLFTQ